VSIKFPRPIRLGGLVAYNTALPRPLFGISQHLQSGFVLEDEPVLGRNRHAFAPGTRNLRTPSHRTMKAVLKAAIVVSLFGPGLAHAQTAPIVLPTLPVTDSAGQDDPTSYAAHYATTGTKTDTPLLESPVNVQVVTPQALKDQQVISIDKALQNVSGITEGGGGANNNGQRFSTVRIRGFASDAFLVDGTRLYSFASDSGLYTLPFAGIDRVEVLKGPAAILYGSLEPGGIVNIISKQPESAPSHQVQQQFGSFGLFRTSIDSTGPLNADGTVAYRFDGSFDNEGSSIQDIFNNSRFLAPTVRWTVDPATEVTAEFKYRYVDFGQNFGTVPLFNGVPVNGQDVNYGGRSPERETTYFGAATWSHRFDSDLTIRQRAVFNWVESNGAGILPSTIATGVATPSGAAVGRVINNVVNRDFNVNLTTDFIKKLSLLGYDNTLLFGGDFARFYQSGHINQAGELDSNISFVDFFNPNFVLSNFVCCTTVLARTTSRIDTAGLYLQDEATLPWRLHLLTGMRLQYLRESRATGRFSPPMSSPRAPGSCGRRPTSSVPMSPM
jgi:iron complex outermembrane recepter protein